MADSKDKIKLVGDTEIEWYNNVSSYLYKNDKKDFRDDTLVGKYRTYNDKFRDITSQKDHGALRINDLWFSIPPQSISIQMTENSIDVPQIRSKHSVKLNTGYGEVAVSLDLVFTDNPILGYSVDEEIMYKLLPLMTQLRTMPFVQVENEFIQERLLDIARNQLQVSQKDIDAQTAIRGKDSDIMLTYISHSISTVQESPRIIQLSLQFSLFNYLPFMSSVRYVKDYDRDGSNQLIRDPQYDKLMRPKEFVYDPFESKPFYEFYAGEMKRSQLILEQNDFSSYSHSGHSQNIELTYFTYTELRRSLVPAKYGVQLKTAKKNYGATTLLQNKTQNPSTYSGVYPTNGKLTSKFGEDRGDHKHNGIDIAAEKNTPIFCVFGDGVIDSVKYNNGNAGNSINIKHADGYMTKYFHMNSFADGMKKGLVVKRNTIIGYVGNTGRSDGNHLHYEVWQNSIPINPVGKQMAGVSVAEIAKISEAAKASKEKPVESTTTSKDKIEADNTKLYLETLEKEYSGRWEFAIQDLYSDIIYVRISHTHSLDLDILSNGMKLISVENTGGNDIPRIPINGYQYATHQFLGGHIEKLRLSFAVTDEMGKATLSDFQNIIAVNNDNSINYKNVAYLDGIGIKNDFINTITASQWFSVDSVGIATDPNIPDAMNVVVELTDYSRIKEYIKRSFEFKMDSRKYEAAFYKEFIHDFFGQIQYTLKIIKNPNNDISGYTDTTTATASTYKTDIFLDFHLTGAANDALANAAKDLFKYLEQVEFNATPQNNIYNIRSIFEKRLDSDGLKDIYKMIWTGAPGVKLEDILRDFALSNYSSLWAYLPNFKKIYTKDAINELEQIVSPAYVDFDLPPTIDPDYYWYQPQKYNYVDVKHEEFLRSRFSTAQKTIGERFIKYKEQLKYAKVNDPQDNTANILYKLYGGYNNGEDYNTMKFDDNYGETASNSSYENVNISMVNSGEMGYDIRNGEKKTDKLNDIYGVKDGLVNADRDANIEEGLMNNVTKTFNFHYQQPSYLEALFRVHGFLNSFRDTTMDMSRCFPVFKVYIIEEDDIEVLAPVRSDINEYYGLNCIQEIRLAEHDDQPVDVLTLRFLDITGRFTSTRFKDKPFTENKRLENRDTERENPFEGIMLKEGSRLQFRFGYRNNINELPIKFNGQVVSIAGDRNEFEIICQSFGAELVYEKKHSDSPKEIATFNAETKEILTWAISHPEIKHFGRWKLRSLDNLQFSEGTSGLNIDTQVITGNNYYSRLRPDGTQQKTWRFVKNQADLNFVAPDESNIAGLDAMFGDMRDNFLDHLLSTIGIGIDPTFTIKVPILAELIRIIQSVFTNYYVYNMTPWEVADEMTYRYPGYILKVLPYEDRNTLYYGPADGNYFARAMKLGEKLEYHSWMKEHKAEYDAAVAAMGYGYTEYEYRDVFTKQIRNDAKILKEGNKYRLKTLKPVRQYINARSSVNIIANNIKADYRDVYTRVQVPYARPDGVGDKEGWKLQDWGGNFITMQMNDFLADEDIRSTQLNFPNCVGKEGEATGAYRYGTHELWRQSKKLYKGNIQLLAEPTLKPYDYIILDDTHSNTFGPVVVREHILSIAPGEGAVSSVVPGMVSDVTNMVSMTMLDTVRYYISSKNNIDDTERITGGYAPAALAAGSVYGIGKTIAMTGVLGTMSIASVPITLAASLGLASLATKLVFAAKYREPVFLSPLIRNGIPYLVGMNHYKIGTMMEWVDHEWKLFGDGLSNFYEYTEIGMKEAYRMWNGERGL